MAATLYTTREIAEMEGECVTEIGYSSMARQTQLVGKKEPNGLSVRLHIVDGRHAGQPKIVELDDGRMWVKASELRDLDAITTLHAWKGMQVRQKSEVNGEIAQGRLAYGGKRSVVLETITKEVINGGIEKEIPGYQILDLGSTNPDNWELVKEA